MRNAWDKSSKMKYGMAWCKFSATLVPLKEIENLMNGILPKNRRWQIQRVFLHLYPRIRPETSLLILKSPHKKIEVNDFSLLLKQWVDFKTASQCGCNNPFGMRSGQTTYHNTRETDGRTKTPEIVITKWGKKMRNTPLKVYAECSNVFIYTFLLCLYQGKASILIDVSYFYCGQ